jgi:two-component system, NarL family, sensor histidine kinase DevS
VLIRRRVGRVPYRSIEDPSILRRLLEATLLIESNLELPEVLRHVVEEARAMTGARFGALGVLDEDKQHLAEFITVGLSAEEERAIGPRPTGRGVLGMLIADPHPIRIREMAGHEESFGFPANHPPMKSFLGVPIKVRDEVYGNLYLTDKEGWSEFTNDDVAVIEALSLAAGIAIENARLHQRARRTAVFEDRDRMARDLHDTVIQRLFALGLVLQGVSARIPAAADQLSSAVSELDDVITQVRSTIYELGMSDVSRGARDDVMVLVRELEKVVGAPVHVALDGPLDTAVPASVLEHLLAVLREALTNVGKHARASTVSVHVQVDESTCTLVIADDGVGVGAGSDAAGGGLGLPNLRRRAEKLHGTLTVADAPDGGTVLTWSVPLAA